jgi:EmrB/QacA subfamily drug resistance transporter
MIDEHEGLKISPEQRRASVIGVMLALFMSALDQTIVSTATPMIIRDLVFPANWITWLTTSYLVTSTALLPIWGKLSDLYGRRRSLEVGLVIFIGASLWCGLSQSPMALILARALQGVGSAAIFANAFAVVGDLFEPRDRPKMQGLFGAMFGLSSVFGPWIGGLLTDYLSWHWVFFVNLPIGIVALTFIGRKMPLLQHTTGKHIDYLGAALLLLFVVPLLLALSLAPNTFAWTSKEVLGMFALSAIAAAFFIRHELNDTDAIIDLRLFAKPAFGITALASFLLGAAFLSSIVFIPLFMVNVLGVSATSSGATLTPLTLGIVAGNIVSGQLVSRIGSYRPVLIPALVMLIAGFVWMAMGLTADLPQWLMIVKLVILGIGLGPSIPLFTQMMINAAPRNKMGVASSTATFVRQMGSSVGVAVLGTVFSATLTANMQNDLLPTIPNQFAQVFAAPSNGGEGSMGATIDFDELKVTVAHDIDAVLLQLEQAKTGDASGLEQVWQQSAMTASLPLPQSNEQVVRVSKQLTAQREFVLKQLDIVHRTFQEVWADAIQHIFYAGLIIVILGFVVTLFIPEVPLPPKRTAAPVAE